jgi:hypothetical protein
MGPSSYIRSIVGRNVVMWRISVYAFYDVFLNKSIHSSIWGKKKSCKEITPKLLFRCNYICRASKSVCFIHDYTILTLRRLWNYANIYYFFASINVNRRPQWPLGLRGESAAARFLGLRVRIPPRAWMSFSCECCVLWGRSRGLCDRLITRLGASYRVWSAWVWSWSLNNQKAVASWRLLRQGGGGDICYPIDEIRSKQNIEIL